MSLIVDLRNDAIRGTFTRGALEVIESLPDMYWRHGPEFRFKSSLANLRHLRRGLLSPITWLDPDRRLEELAAADALMAAGHRKPDANDYGYAFKTQPLGRQIEAFAFARKLPYFALLNDPGTGKTWCALNIAAAKFEADEIDTLLIVAPNGVHAQWVDEQIPLHLPDIEHRATIYRPSLTAQREALAPLPEGLRILSVNVEAMSRGNASKFVEKFVRSGRCMIVMDEATRIKNWSAKRTKAMLRLRDLATCRAILTGTPITKGVTDLYSMFMFLHPDILGFSTFTRFRERYCVTAPAFRGAAMGVVKIVGYRNVGELTSKLAPFCFRMTKEGLPEKVFETRRIELSAEQREHYNRLVEDFRTSIEGGTLTAINAAARTVRLQQILSGFVVTNGEDDDGEAVAIPEYRTRSLVDLLEDLGDRQVVVWTKFHFDADAIAKALQGARISYVVCDGRTDTAERTRRKQAFIDGRARVFVANPAAMGTGTDGLQCAPVTVFYSHSYDAEQTWQAENRTHREGMTADGGTYYRFVAPHTIDEQVLANTAGKATLAERIVNDPSILQTV